MSFNYTKTRLENDVNGLINNRSDMIIDFDTVLNNTATEVITDFTLRSAKRRARLSPGIYEDVFEYMAPDDLDAENIIDIVADNNERHDREWGLTTTELLRNRPHRHDRVYGYNSLVAVDEFDGEKRILLSTLDRLEASTIISALNSLSENDSSWTTVGDAENIHLDKYSYKQGSGSIAVDVNDDGGLTFGIENNDLEAIDIDESYFYDTGSIFVEVFIPSNADKINGFNLKLGSSASDYYEMATASRHDGTELTIGWNLVRFDLGSASTTGAPDKSAINYVAVILDKDASLTDVTDFKFDHIVLRAEEMHNLFYYTNFPWVSAAGVYKREATTGTDLLVAEADEYKLYKLKGLALALSEIEEEERAQTVSNKYEMALEKYRMKNPSNALVKTTMYEEFHNPEPGSRSGRIV